jgi:hypothetical protein
MQASVQPGLQLSKDPWGTPGRDNLPDKSTVPFRTAIGQGHHAV